MKSDLDKLVAEVVPATVRKFCLSPFFSEMVLQTCIETAMEHPRGPFTEIGFAYRIAGALQRGGIELRDAVRLGFATLSEWLADGKMQYGDTRFAWDGSAADELANEYVLSHAEAKS